MNRTIRNILKSGVMVLCLAFFASASAQDNVTVGYDANDVVVASYYDCCDGCKGGKKKPETVAKNTKGDCKGGDCKGCEGGNCKKDGEAKAKKAKGEKGCCGGCKGGNCGGGKSQNAKKEK